MVLARVKNVKSGWKSMFMVYTTAASDDSQMIVRLAFETIEKIVREHFDFITETEVTTFTDCVNCLIAFTNNPHSLDVSLNAIAFLRFCAMKLAEGAIGIPLSTIALQPVMVKFEPADQCNFLRDCWTSMPVSIDACVLHADPSAMSAPASMAVTGSIPPFAASQAGTTAWSAALQHCIKISLPWPCCNLLHSAAKCAMPTEGACAGDVEQLPEGPVPALPSPRRIRPAAYEAQDSMLPSSRPGRSTFDTILQADAPHAANTEDLEVRCHCAVLHPA